MITYENTVNDFVIVRLNKKIVGMICPMDMGGFAYQPKGSKTFGETFMTVAEVKRSLEEE